MLSINVSTPRSIGWIIIGMEANPTRVGMSLTHLPPILCAFVCFRNICVPQQIRFIVNPGIMTLASICQMSVSPLATSAPLVPPPSASGNLWRFFALSNYEKKTYNFHSKCLRKWRKSYSITEHITDGDGVTRVYNLFFHERSEGFTNLIAVT